MSFFVAFKTIPAVKFAVAITFLLGSLISSYYFLEIWKLNKQNQIILSQKIELENNLEANLAGINYENSGLYFERKLKQENFIISGEKVVDTSAVEPFEIKKSYHYLPMQTETKNNLELWADCIIKSNPALSNQNPNTNCK